MKIEVNGKPIEAEIGETILSAVQRSGFEIPTLCHIEGLPPSGACRVCVVEVEGQRGLIPSCSFPVNEGMKIQTHSPRALKARKTIVELLLAAHPNDCNYCGRNNRCKLQMLAAELGVRRWPSHGSGDIHKLDVSSASLVRDPQKCILCGRCVRICEEIQGVSAIDFIRRGARTRIGTAFEEGLNVSSCINCGQCVLGCPTGALVEQDHLRKVIEALQNPKKIRVVQHAPAVSVTLAEEFGLKPGADVDGKMVAALRKIGFNKVFDTSFTADLTIMEEGSELVHRLNHGGKLPLLTSCSPGWVKFVEQFFPDFIGNLSTCKSPQQMLGAVVKTYWAEREKVEPENIYCVSVMPCTAKKFEAGRPEMGRNGLSDVDAVLTTRELGKLLRMYGISLNTIEPEGADTPFGTRSSAGKLFGVTGGVMEAAVRSAYHLITGSELKELKIEAVRGLEGIKVAYIPVGKINLGVAVASSLMNARKLLEEIRGGRKDIHFIEVMTCPGGCIAGGGQPFDTNLVAVKARMQALYKIDRDDRLRVSHGNPDVQRLYKEFLGAPLGEKSHHLLHTHYVARDVVK